MLRPRWNSVVVSKPKRDVNCLVTNGREFAIGTWHPVNEFWDTATAMPKPPTHWVSLASLDLMLNGHPFAIDTSDREFLIAAAHAGASDAQAVIGAEVERIGRRAGLIGEPPQDAGEAPTIESLEPGCILKLKNGREIRVPPDPGPR